MQDPDLTADEAMKLPLWAQVTLCVWSVGVVVFFVRQMLVAYLAALSGG